MFVLVVQGEILKERTEDILTEASSIADHIAKGSGIIPDFDFFFSMT